MSIFWIIIILDVVAMLIAIGAETNINSKYKKYSQIACNNSLTGKDVAERILKDNDIEEISVNEITQRLGDHYNHRKKELNLSSDIYNGSTIASIAVAAHEAGHAIQYKQGYFGIKLRNFVIPLSNFATRMFLPIFIIGLIFSATTIMFAGTTLGEIIMIFALVTLGLSVLVNLVTLPVEFDASKRALAEIERMNLVDEMEMDGTKSMLRAAALTYVASLAVSLIYVLQHILIILSFFNRE